MKLEDRVRILDDIASGSLALRDLAGLSRTDVDAIADLAKEAYQARKFEQAIRILTGLEALEPDRPIHSLHRAYAEARGGRAEDAKASATRYIDHEDVRPPAQMVRALLFRAGLVKAKDPEAAGLDEAAARLLAERFPEAQSVFEASGSRR